MNELPENIEINLPADQHTPNDILPNQTSDGNLKE